MFEKQLIVYFIISKEMRKLKKFHWKEHNYYEIQLIKISKIRNIM